MNDFPGFPLAKWRDVCAAKDACYWRLHPRPWIDTSRGARILYDAVCDLWNAWIVNKEAH